jgi:hypothetical protein
MGVAVGGNALDGFGEGVTEGDELIDLGNDAIFFGDGGIKIERSRIGQT